MNIRDMTWYRKHKIAIRLLFVMILQLCSPLSNIFVYAASPISKPNLDGPSLLCKKIFYILVTNQFKV